MLRHVIRICLLALAMLGFCSVPASAQSRHNGGTPQHPNVIFILLDAAF